MRYIQLLPIVICFIFISCMDNIPLDLKLKNNSKKSIYSILSDSDKFIAEGYYEEFQKNETYVKTKKDSIYSFVFTEILPNTIESCHDRPLNWEEYFKSLPDGKMRMFIISKDSVEKHKWYKIFKNQIYIKKFELTLQDLKDKNWEIVYDSN